MNVLKWKTTNISKKDYFLIERKYESGDFQTIGKVTKHEAKAHALSYTYTDYDVEQSGIYFYRLKQVTNDGEFSYQRVVQIFVFDGIKDLLENLRKKKSDFHQISLPIPTESFTFLKVEISNSAGKVVLTEIINTKGKAPHLIHDIDLKDLGSGNFVLNVFVNYELTSTTFLDRN